jgi:hypothetical protein
MNGIDIPGPPPIPERPCAWCGTLYRPRWHQQRYHAHWCAWAAKDAKDAESWRRRAEAGKAAAQDGGEA